MTKKFPVLTKGPTPNLHLDRWRFRLFGSVANDVELTYSEFMPLPQATVTTDFHCVTRWSMLDSAWMGIHISEVLKKVDVLSNTRFVMIHGHGQYTTNLPLADLRDDDVLFAHSWDGDTLSKNHGGP